MKYLFVLIFIIIYACFGLELGYTKTSPVWTHFTYMFQHAGIIHLIINSLAFIGMFRVCQKCIKNWVLALFILSVGFFASFISMYDIPTVGCSSCVYAMIGIYFSLIATKRLTVMSYSSFWTFVLAISITLTISFFKLNSNFFLHLYSLIIGFIVGMVYENIIMIKNEEMFYKKI